MSVGIVLVSHSARLAEGLAELAAQMAPEVRIEPAGGTDDGGIGTSYGRIEAALARARTGDGDAVILCDLGSAVMTAETLLETLDDGERAHVALADAPLVEGAVAAAVAASSGGDLSAVARAAEDAWGRSAVDRSADGADSVRGTAAAVPSQHPSPADPADAGAERRTMTLVNDEGLHARPAAQFAKLASGFDAEVTVNGVDATSLLRIMGLGLAKGATIELEASGPEAREALDALERLVGEGFGEP